MQIVGIVCVGVEKCLDQYFVEDGVFKLGWIGGQGGGVVEVFGIWMFDYIVFDVIVLYGRVFDVVFCFVYCFYDVMCMGDGIWGFMW